MTNTSAVLRVGDGRGFVVRYYTQNIIITAAHCLPHFPPCHLFSYLHERTYKLLGPLKSKPAVWAECWFADPIADIAVLGQPDGQELSDEAEAYDQLVDNVEPFIVADAPAQVESATPSEGPARVLSLDGEWLDVRLQRRGNHLLVQPEKLIVAGMSGSPIVSLADEAIGLLSTSNIGPVLVDSLSASLVRGINQASNVG